jgi:hypothetical protein
MILRRKHSEGVFDLGLYIMGADSRRGWRADRLLFPADVVEIAIKRYSNIGFVGLLERFESIGYIVYVGPITILLGAVVWELDVH